MEDDPESEFRKVFVPGDCAIKITKWKVRKGTNVSKGVVLAIYDALNPESVQKNLKLKSSDGGIVQNIEVDEGEEIKPGSLLLTIGAPADEPCSHPTVMKDMCAVCGADLRSEMGMAGDRKETVSASVAMVHSIPELIVSEQQAIELGQEDVNRLLKTRKLVLLVDLDQTLIHTTNDNIPPKLKDVSHFQLWHGPSLLWYHTKFRPYTKKFLEKVSQMYELHICTFGVRMYAHTIARLLDPKEKFFSHRILSRDECFNAMSKTANLKALFPCGDSMVCIIDDREDVWNYSPNLIHVKPYRFFQGTADINAPPGLTKTENDNIPVIHRVRRASDCQDGKAETKAPDSKEKIQDVEMEDDTKSTKSKSSEIQVNGTDSPEKLTSDSKSEPMDSNPESDNKTNNHKEMEKDNSSDEAKFTESDKGSNAEKPSVKDEKDDPKDNDDTENKDNPKDKDGKTADKDKLAEEPVRECAESPESPEVQDGEGEEELEWEDEDDYLYHLEEILTRIHKAFYDLHDQTKSKESESKLPNLKDIIPYVKRKVLKGCNIVFSGVVPLNMQLEKCRAYTVARSLGATVQKSIVARKEDNKAIATTHLVAAKPGTAKVNTAMKTKGVSIVNANWLWSCAERWERVEEVLFALDDSTGITSKSNPWSNRDDKQQDTSNSSINKRKSDEMIDDNETTDSQDSVAKKSKKSKKAKLKRDDDDVFGEGQAPADGAVAGPSRSRREKSKENTSFASSYNPLYSFSDADIEFMDKEVDEFMDEESDSEAEDEEDRNERIRQSVLGDVSDSSTEESLAGDFPRGWNIRKRSPSGNSEEEKPKEPAEGEDSDNEMENYEKTVQAFSAENSQSSESGDSVGSVDDEIADAVEKEFLSLL